MVTFIIEKTKQKNEYYKAVKSLKSANYEQMLKYSDVHRMRADLTPLFSPVCGTVGPPPHCLLHLGGPSSSLLQLPESQLLPALPVWPGAFSHDPQGTKTDASKAGREEQWWARAGRFSCGAGRVGEAVWGADPPVGPQTQAAQKAASGDLAIRQVGARGVVHDEE